MSSAFVVLTRLLNERMLAETLRYLIDSNEEHDHGDAFLKAIAEHAGWSLPDRRLDITARAESRTSRGRKIDIMVVVRTNPLKDPKLVIGIEAKFTAKELDRQIGDYQKAVEEMFPSIQKRLLFLTVDGRRPISHAPEHHTGCPVDTMRWSDIAACAGSLGGLGAEFAAYLEKRFYPPLNATAGAIDLIEGKVLPKVRKLLKLRPRELSVAWRWPNNAPKEFNLDSICAGTKVIFIICCIHLRES